MHIGEKYTQKGFCVISRVKAEVVHLLFFFFFNLTNCMSRHIWANTKWPSLPAEGKFRQRCAHGFLFRPTCFVENLQQAILL